MRRGRAATVTCTYSTSKIETINEGEACARLSHRRAMEKARARVKERKEEKNWDTISMRKKIYIVVLISMRTRRERKRTAEKKTTIVRAFVVVFVVVFFCFVIHMCACECPRRHINLSLLCCSRFLCCLTNVLSRPDRRRCRRFSLRYSTICCIWRRTWNERKRERENDRPVTSAAREKSHLLFDRMAAPLPMPLIDRWKDQPIGKEC